MTEGDRYFDKIWEGYGEENEGDNLEKAIELYEKALKKSPKSVEIAWRLTRALYYQGTYFEESKREKQKIFEKAISVGEKALKAKEGKSSAELNYWMAINWGRWGEVFGILAAARKGIADKVRKFAEKAVELDPELDDGGGYRLLGRLHHQAPRIPVILSWPSNKKAIKYLDKAVEISPDSISNKWFLADVLYEEGKKERAIEIVKDIVEKAPGDSNPEDEETLNDCKKALGKWTR